MILVAIIRTRSLCGYRYLHRPSTVTQSRSRPISAIRVHMYVPHTHSLRNHLPFPHPSSYLRTYPMPRTLSIQIHHITHLFRDSNHSIVLPPPPYLRQEIAHWSHGSTHSIRSRTPTNHAQKGYSGVTYKLQFHVSRTDYRVAYVC